MICFYHSADLDGHCSGAIVKKFNLDCELIGINFGDEFPWEKVKGEKVVMVDFSLPIEEMIRLQDESESFYWIDHHISAIKDAEECDFNPLGQRGIGRAACELTWKYFSNSSWLPKIVTLLGRYDVWDHEDPEVLPFQYGIRQYSTYPDDSAWDVWFREFPEYILTEGKIILKYADEENRKYAKGCTFETELDGLRCIAVNKMLTNSKIFDSVFDPDKHDVMLTFGFRKGGWMVSLYSQRGGVDVSIVAKAHGGGGHKGAAGFSCDELPFNLVKL